MARGKKTKSRKDLKPKAPARAKAKRADGAGGRVVVKAFVAAAAIVAAALGLGLMRRSLLSSPRYSDARAHVRLVAVPSWLPADVRGRVLADLSAVASGRSLYDDDLTQDLYEAGGRDPWIARVREVRKEADGTVAVQADYRRPFALVGSMKLEPSDLRVVDADGVILPLNPQRVRDKSLILIRDVASAPPETGQAWRAPDLLDGLRLLKILQDEPFIHEVPAIDVRSYFSKVSATDPRLGFWAQRGRGRATYYCFGGLPAADGLDPAVPVEQRVGYLRDYYGKHGTLAGIHRRIDLRFDTMYDVVH